MKQQQMHCRSAVWALLAAGILGMASMAAAEEATLKVNKVVNKVGTASVVFKVQPTATEIQLLAKASDLEARRLRTAKVAAATGATGTSSVVLSGGILNVAIVDSAGATTCFDSLSEALTALGTAPALEEK